MNINEVIREYDNLRHQAERLVAEYFGVSGYKVANVNIEEDMLELGYEDEDIKSLLFSYSKVYPSKIEEYYLSHRKTETMII